MFNYYEYKLFFIYFIFCLIISCLIFVLSLFLIKQNNYFEKISVYECGFYPFSDYQGTFDIHFYFFAILFLIFDLEIIFLFPWILCIKFINVLGFWIMFVFLGILLIGFFYEWKKGLLNWK